jgi:hypothetical protein
MRATTPKYWRIGGIQLDDGIIAALAVADFARVADANAAHWIDQAVHVIFFIESRTLARALLCACWCMARSAA